MDLTQAVATNLRRMRAAKGWTQEELADRVGLSVRYIGKVERAAASPTVAVLGRLAEALAADPCDLLRR